MATAVVIPAYKPDESLLDLLRALLQAVQQLVVFVAVLHLENPSFLMRHAARAAARCFPIGALRAPPGEEGRGMGRISPFRFGGVDDRGQPVLRAHQRAEGGEGVRLAPVGRKAEARRRRHRLGPPLDEGGVQRDEIREIPVGAEHAAVVGGAEIVVLRPAGEQLLHIGAMGGRRLRDRLL